MTQPVRDHTRRNQLVFSFCLAAVMGTALTIGEDIEAGLRSFAIVFGFAIVTCLVPKDRFELIRVGPKDERQTALGFEAIAISGMAMATFALAGAIWDMASGRTSEFALVCFVGGLSFILAQLILPRRR